jgi:hypothetical protein
MRGLVAKRESFGSLLSLERSERRGSVIILL